MMIDVPLYLFRAKLVLSVNMYVLFVNRYQWPRIGWSSRMCCRVMSTSIKIIRSLSIIIFSASHITSSLLLLPHQRYAILTRTLKYVNESYVCCLATAFMTIIGLPVEMYFPTNSQMLEFVRNGKLYVFC